jgi:hypothetical protein
VYLNNLARGLRFLHKDEKFSQHERFWSVRKGFDRVGVNFNDKPISTSCNGRERNRFNHFSMLNCMAWVNNNEKIGVLFQGRYTNYIENISCGGLEAAGAELGKNYLLVVFGKKIFGIHEKLLNVSNHAPFF